MSSTQRASDGQLSVDTASAFDGFFAASASGGGSSHRGGTFPAEVSAQQPRPCRSTNHPGLGLGLAEDVLQGMGIMIVTWRWCRGSDPAGQEASRLA